MIALIMTPTMKGENLARVLHVKGFFLLSLECQFVSRALSNYIFHFHILSAHVKATISNLSCLETLRGGEGRFFEKFIFESVIHSFFCEKSSTLADLTLSPLSDVT